MILRLLLLMAAIGMTITGQPAIAQEAVPVIPLLETDLFDWYQAQTAVEIDARYAGAYVMVAVGDRVYLGLSASVPTHDHGGALFAAVDASGIDLIAPLDEQDVNRMKVIGQTIFIPGYDPAAGDSWDAGNLYLYDTTDQIFTKLRYRSDDLHFVDATTTDSGGYYQFDGLKPGSYLVKFFPPDGYAFSERQVRQYVDADNRRINPILRDSNPQPGNGTDHTCINGNYQPFQATAPFIENSIDAGLYPAPDARFNPNLHGEPDPAFYDGQMSIGNWVWLDQNRNGIQDGGESGVAEVRVELYTYDPYFPCVIHAAGIWGDADSGTIYYNGGVIGGNIIFISEDFGASWRIFAQDDEHYWARDLIFFNGYFYKIHRSQRWRGYDFAADASLHVSADLQDWQRVDFPPSEPATYRDADGNDWQINPMNMDETNALVIFQDQLIVLHPSGDHLFAIQAEADHSILPIAGADLSGLLPAFREPDFPPVPNTITGATNRYNTLANAADQLLYAIGGDNVLYATSDLQTWFPVADFNQVGAGEPLIALTYWSARDQIVAATAGAGGGIYAIDHAAVVASQSSP